MDAEDEVPLKVYVGSHGRLKSRGERRDRARSMASLSPVFRNESLATGGSQAPPPLPTLTLAHKQRPPKTGPSLYKQPPLQAGAARANQTFNRYLNDQVNKPRENITKLIQDVLREVVVYKPADPLMCVPAYCTCVPAYLRACVPACLRARVPRDSTLLHHHCHFFLKPWAHCAMVAAHRRVCF